LARRSQRRTLEIVKEAIMIELTHEQQQSLVAFPETPARAIDPATGRIDVLLRSDDFDWVRGMLGNEPDTPRRTDPRTGKEYAVLPEERYKRFKAFFEEDPLTFAERKALLREAGKRAGWDSPEWDGTE
jgi:hypothetical protein